METFRTQNRFILFYLLALWKAVNLVNAGGDVSAAEAGRRAHVADITEFGGFGDGVTSNTKAFRDAVANLSRRDTAGGGGGCGGMLVVPAGRWLTGPFNLTSHFTLFLHSDAVILASTDMNEYPIVSPLPSYGRGRDLPGGRYSNFIWGSNLTDVIITGENGTINGNGQFWWDKFHKKELNSTRGHLLELMYSENILITNLTFINSPFWNLHPVYCRNVIIAKVTILAPVDSPNTDGINPDSSSNVLIEDNFIISGDDCVAIKSGWDEYGIRVGIPSEQITVRRLTCISPSSAVIAIGSEMSGGVRQIFAEDIFAINSESALRIKTAVGRGGFVRDVFVRGMTLHTMKYVLWFAVNYGNHPDDGWDPAALPEIERIRFGDVFAENVTMAGRLEGIENVRFRDVLLSNLTAMPSVPAGKKLQWNCTYVEGTAYKVSPKPCAELGQTEEPLDTSGPPVGAEDFFFLRN